MRDPNSETITNAVIATLDGAKDPRTAEILEALVRHAHAFVREVGLTEEEWATGIDFLTRTGHLCTPTRQEFILLSDVLGVTMLVDALNHQRESVATENSVIGPYFREDRPEHSPAADISGGLTGTPLFFEGLVTDHKGEPVADAAVDVWHSDADGHYDVDVPGLQRPRCAPCCGVTAKAASPSVPSVRRATRFRGTGRWASSCGPRTGP
ncbi:dioxygenase [Streptomyces sp. NPDC002758]